MWNSISNWFKELAYEEYELTVWFKDKEEIIDGRKIHPRTKKVFRLKNVSKKTPTHIKGQELDGKNFEIRTVEPFDYMLRKIY
tara:strand:- start:312 stop:560 length:249 start_codon:yes stop_codon:yes gene_type:complete